MSDEFEASEGDTTRLVKNKAGLLETKVRGKVVRFKVLASRPSLAFDLVQHYAANPMFVRAAAIGLYMFGAGKPDACSAPYTNALAWGSAVLDELLPGGWTPTDVREVGEELVVAAFATLPDFSAAEEAGIPLQEAGTTNGTD